MSDPADMWKRLGRAVYDFGEADAAANGHEPHGPFDEAPASFQDFCERMARHVVGLADQLRADPRFEVKPGEDVVYPCAANQTRKDVN